MRKSLILLSLLLGASPALAEKPAPRLADPAIADRLTNAMQVLSSTLLDLRVGRVEAALQGREPTPAERNRTVRDLARRDDPNFDRKVQQRIAEARPVMRQSLKALNEVLPSMIQGLQQAQKSFERAVANMPDPTYPQR